jgi:hypothetical protein
VEEHWVLAAAGAVTALLVLCLGLATGWSVQQRDTDLNTAAAAAHRLGPCGLDDDLEQGLIALQLSEVAQFQDRVDIGGLPYVQTSGTSGAAADSGGTSTCPAGTTGAASGDLSALQSELADIAGPPSARAGASLISQELPVYLNLEATALSDGREGLPVGAAYVREASLYFTSNLLASAERIRAADLDTVAADDSGAAAFPLWLVLADALTLAWLVAAWVRLARFTRRAVNAGLAAALLAVVVLTAWSLPAILLARGRIDGSAAPSASTAAGLARVRIDADNARIDDQLTLSDNGEDCSFSTGNPVSTTNDPTADPYASAYVATCTYETAAEAELAPGTGILAHDLSTAVAATGDAAATRQLDGQIIAKARVWDTGEQSLPTLQNLNSAVKGVLADNQAPHFDPQFLTGTLDPYTASSAQTSDNNEATGWFDGVLDLVVPRMDAQWNAYVGAESDAASPLSGLVLGGILLGLIGAAGAAAGAGVRVADYWTRGRQDAPRYTSAPLAEQPSER